MNDFISLAFYDEIEKIAGLKSTLLSGARKAGRWGEKSLTPTQKFKAVKSGLSSRVMAQTPGISPREAAERAFATSSKSTRGASLRQRVGMASYQHRRFFGPRPK